MGISGVYIDGKEEGFFVCMRDEGVVGGWWEIR